MQRQKSCRFVIKRCILNNSITFTATDITINARNNAYISSGNNFTTNIGNNWLISVGNAINSVASRIRNIIAGSLNMFTGISLWSSREKMQIQTDSFTAIGSKKMFLHSDEKLLANSKGTLDIKSDGHVNTSSKADEAKKERAGEISIAMVEFRPTSTYNGSFGFDWLRVDDNKLEKKSHYPAEQPYGNIIEGGYGDGKTDLTDGKDGSAYKKLKSEYKKIIVNMQDKSDDSKRTKEYFVPYLSIYPKSYVDTFTNTDQKNKPVFEAELALLVDIGVDEIDSLEFKYDKKLFDLDKNKLQDTKRTADGKQFSVDKTIKITCKEEIPDLSSGEIYVYAYPKDAKGKPAAEREAMRSLAGKIQVLPNGEEQRKKLKIVVICVKTNIAGTIRTGVISDEEINRFQNTLHQGMVECKIEQYREDEFGRVLIDEEGKSMVIKLDLSQNKEYKIGGKYVNTNGNINEDIDKCSVFTDLRNIFFSDKKNLHYMGYMTIFIFDEKAYDGIVGQVQGIGKKNLILFQGRNDKTLSHEGLHGLGLYHTHRDKTPIQKRDQKYVYPNAHSSSLKATDNIMSYNGALRKTTWNWQWEILRRNL